MMKASIVQLVLISMDYINILMLMLKTFMGYKECLGMVLVYIFFNVGLKYYWKIYDYSKWFNGIV